MYNGVNHKPFHTVPVYRRIIQYLRNYRAFYAFLTCSTGEVVSFNPAVLGFRPFKIDTQRTCC